MNSGKVPQRGPDVQEVPSVAAPAGQCGNYTQNAAQLLPSYPEVAVVVVVEGGEELLRGGDEGDELELPLPAPGRGETVLEQTLVGVTSWPKAAAHHGVMLMTHTENYTMSHIFVFHYL